MTFTLAQISDTHLGAGTSLFRANFDHVAAALHDIRPDLLIHTGDASLDGRGQGRGTWPTPPAPTPATRSCVLRAGQPRRGRPSSACAEAAGGRCPAHRFRRHLGQDRWMHDRPGWRLLGLNSQVMGAHPEAEAQAAMIAAALDTLGGRRLAVFIHKPFFANDPDEASFDYWSVPPVARGPLRSVMAHPGLRLVASGHLHLHREAQPGPVRSSGRRPPPSSLLLPSSRTCRGPALRLPGARIRGGCRDPPAW